MLLVLSLVLADSIQAHQQSIFHFNTDSVRDIELTISTIRYEGNRITKENIISRELTFRIGEMVLGNDLKAKLDYNVSRILNLQLFSVVYYEAWLKGHELVIEFHVTEIFYWIAKPEVTLADRNLNVWWFEQKHDLDRINGGATIIRHNFRGTNEEILAHFQVGYNKLFEFSYQIPYIDKKLHSGLGLSGTFETGREISFITDSNKLQFFRNENYPYKRFQVALHYTYRRAYAAIHEFRIGFHNYSISSDLYQANPRYFDHKTQMRFLQLDYILKYNNTDIRIYPLRGSDIKFIISKKGLGLDQDLNRLDLQTQSSWYYKLRHDLSMSFVFRGRLTFPQHQPYYFNRALGFKNEYLRGYEYYVIDGTHYALLRTNLRYKIIDRVLSQSLVKFMHYIPLRVYGKIFDDVGYVYEQHKTNSFLNNQILNGYGIGLDLVLSYYVRCRIEYSFNHLGQKGLFLHGSKE